MFDVVALGELLIDFSPAGTGKMGNPAFEMNPGGAPANCLAQISAFGGKTAMIAKVGEDTFGHFLKDQLGIANIDTSGVASSNIHTTLAFVHIDKDAQRRFEFYRKPGADILLTKREVDRKLIDKCSIFHFGALSLTDQPSRETTFYAVNYAKSQGKLISYDPNYREMLFGSEGSAKKLINLGLKLADIVKLSDEEMKFLGYGDIEAGMSEILSMGKQAVFVTLGKDGAMYATNEAKGKIDGFEVDAIDTTGCGDSFMGAILYAKLCLTNFSVEDSVRLACAAGALCATKMGGVPAMPKFEEAYGLAYPMDN